jgi:hypothetical protein
MLLEEGVEPVGASACQWMITASFYTHLIFAFIVLWK